MVLARLLAKAWIAVCLFAGAVGLTQAWGEGAGLLALSLRTVSILLFVAMGLVFALGGVCLAGRARMLHRRWRRGHPWHWTGDFDEAVWALFALLSFLDLVFFAPTHLSSPATEAVELAAYVAVPGHRAFVSLARPCLFDGGRIFASAFSWCLALIYLGSAFSRLKMRVVRLRALQKAHPQIAAGRADIVLLSLAAVVGIQLFYIGSGYSVLSCSVLTGALGAATIGLAPLLLAFAAVTVATWIAARGG